MQLHPALAIELVAAEPQVVDPVAIAFDEQGRMWVAEMSDYPNGPAEGEAPRSRIRLLEDRDGDGRFESSTLFADNLLFANGVHPWNGGVIVTLSGEVAWLKDTTGDGKADLRETWFTGFKEENPQLRANHPTFGIDNHIYVANGLRGGDVIARRTEWSENAKPVSISGMDFRFDPHSGRYEAVSGNGQFGLTFDDFGNRFVCSNRNPSNHVVLEDRYLKRNPFLGVRQVFEEVSPAGDASRVFAISRTWTTSTLHEGQFTAACGVTIYRGDLLPAEFRGNSFTCEPTGNLVHRDVLEPRGATFTSHYGRKGVEFLASRDEWFRPVNLANGPDGALYVVDMYRAVIEHPQFMPTELKERPDLYHGNDRGRIYRIVPAGNGPRAVPPTTVRSRFRIDPLSPPLLVELLEHPNAWHRETAARLLYEQRDRAAAEPLASLAARGKSPEARIQALWLLQGQGRLHVETLRRALGDDNPRVVEHAIRLAENRLHNTADLTAAVVAASRSDDARVRFQAALSLGETAAMKETGGAAGDILLTSDLIQTLAAIASRAGDDVWTHNAVLSSVPGQPVQLLAAVLKPQHDRSPPSPAFIERAAEIVGSRTIADEIAQALSLLDGPFSEHRQDKESSRIDLQFALLRGVGEGLRRRGKRLDAYLTAFDEPLKKSVARVFEAAGMLAADESLAADRRVAAVTVLRHAGKQTAVAPLKTLFAQSRDNSLRLAAIDALGAFDDPSIGPLLLNDFASQTPSVTRALLDAVLSDTPRTKLLLDEIESGRIRASMLDAAAVNRLTKHRDAEIRERATKLLAAAVPADRQKVLADYQPALSLNADPARGREVFKKTCVACHRIGDLGVNVAPDIADSRTKTPEQLLVSILDPNRAIDNNYFSYTVVTLDGKVHTGIVAAETASSVTLRQPENKEVTLLRQDIDEMRSNGVSLMPVGVEKDITVQQMADLIAFIKNWRYLEGQAPKSSRQ